METAKHSGELEQALKILTDRERKLITALAEIKTLRKQNAELLEKVRELMKVGRLSTIT